MKTLAPESKQAASSSDATGVTTHKKIQELAYHLYLQRGKEPGHALDDWLEAEKRARTLIAEKTFGGIE
jgi:Protein of unknown function (DUF2934)